MTNYFSVKKNTNYTLTVSKSGYNTHTETINISADTTKNITLTPEFTPTTTRFDYTGDVQTYTVPQGVTKLIVDCVGAASGDLYTNTQYRGRGGRVQCTLSVTQGQLLYLYVGGKGTDFTTPGQTSAGGWNGGGTGYSHEDSYPTGCAGGGGASDIRIGGTALTDRKVVAGGGGGPAAGGYRQYTPQGAGGHGGGLVAGDGYYVGQGTAMDTIFGKGGTQVSGGAGGYGTYYFDYAAQDGSFGIGADGITNSIASILATPGAGGGYYGGGAGATPDSFPVGSSGGGSSYTDSTLCTNVIHTQGYSAATGNGWIIITTSNE